MVMRELQQVAYTVFLMGVTHFDVTLHIVCKTLCSDEL